MNFNNMDNTINLLVCLFIITYHESNFINLPHNIVNILRNPIVLLILLLTLIFIIKNKTLMFLLIILYFVVILKSDSSNLINETEQETDEQETDEQETDEDLHSDSFIEDIDQEDKDEEEQEQPQEQHPEKQQQKQQQKQQHHQEKKDNYTLLNNNDLIEQDNYEIVKDINQNKNIISNVTQTQLDTIQGNNYNHCK